MVPVADAPEEAPLDSLDHGDLVAISGGEESQRSTASLEQEGTQSSPLLFSPLKRVSETIAPSPLYSEVTYSKRQKEDPG